MSTFEFSLIFALPNSQDEPEMYVDTLYQNGCDDALIGIGKNGFIALEFDREAKTAELAVESAIKDVASVIQDAKLVSVGPDHVGITEISEHLQCTRQNVRQNYIVSDDFPLPFSVSPSTLWHLVDVLAWAEHSSRRLQIDRNLLEISRLAYKCNQKIDRKRHAGLWVFEGSFVSHILDAEITGILEKRINEKSSTEKAKWNAVFERYVSSEIMSPTYSRAANDSRMIPGYESLL